MDDSDRPSDSNDRLSGSDDRPSLTRDDRPSLTPAYNYLAQSLSRQVK